MAKINGNDVLFGAEINIRGSGAGGYVILPVASLPTGNINTNVFYRIQNNDDTCELWWYDGKEWHRVVNVGDVLPEVHTRTLYVGDEAVFGDNDQVTIDSTGITVATENSAVEIGKGKSGIAINNYAVLTEAHLPITSLSTDMEKHTSIKMSAGGISWQNEAEIEVDDGTKYVYAPYHGSVPLIAGDNITFEVDEEKGVVKIHAKGGAPMLSVTYSELKALRDSGSLIAGMCYRITDYQCTSVQENTRAMDNKFDIIVQALSNNTLSETASADYHGVDGYFVTQEESEETDYNAFELGAVEFYYRDFIDFNNQNNVVENYKKDDKIIAYDYLPNNKGTVVPVIYKTDIGGYANEPDTVDVFYYIGTATISGTIYDKWRLISEGHKDGPFWNGSTGEIYTYTNRIVENNEIIDSVKVKPKIVKHANIPAWELKYCLDNDNTRFAWAVEGQAITNLNSFFSNGAPLTRQPSMDGSGSEYIYAWGVQADADDGHVENCIYSKTEIIKTGDTVLEGATGNIYVAEVVEGKGVIYYMKDEHGNVCPYDFKNIQFKRMVSLENGYPQLDEENGEETWVYTFCGNSYHIDNDEWSELKDGSLESPYGHMSDEGNSTFHHNVIKPYVRQIDWDEESHTKCGKVYLNNIVLFGYWEEIGSTEDEYAYYYPYCCYNNTFGNDCYNNTLNICCVNNNFGNNFIEQIGDNIVHSAYVSGRKLVSGLTEHNIEITTKSSYTGPKFHLYKIVYDTYTGAHNIYFMNNIFIVGARTMCSGTIVVTDDDETTHVYNVTHCELLSNGILTVRFTDETGSDRGISYQTSNFTVSDTYRQL